MCLPTAAVALEEWCGSATQRYFMFEEEQWRSCGIAVVLGEDEKSVWTVEKGKKLL